MYFEVGHSTHCNLPRKYLMNKRRK